MLYESSLGFALLCLLYGTCCIIHLPNLDEKLVIIKFCLLLDRNLMFLICLSIVLLIFLYRSYVVFPDLSFHCSTDISV
jgi:hypothetical protein